MAEVQCAAKQTQSKAMLACNFSTSLSAAVTGLERKVVTSTVRKIINREDRYRTHFKTK